MLFSSRCPNAFFFPSFFLSAFPYRSCYHAQPNLPTPSMPESYVVFTCVHRSSATVPFGCFLSLFVCLVSEIPLKECSFFFFQSVLCCCCSSMLLFCRLNLCAAAREFLLALPPPLSLLPPFHHLPLGEALFVCRYCFFFFCKRCFLVDAFEYVHTHVHGIFL